MIDYLLSQLRDATSDVVRHGGCLGVGLAAMGTARQDVYDQLKHCLELDDAVTGYWKFILIIFTSAVYPTSSSHLHSSDMLCL